MQVPKDKTRVQDQMMGQSCRAERINFIEIVFRIIDDSFKRDE